VPFLKGLLVASIVCSAASAAAVSPEKSPGLARRALEARADWPIEEQVQRPRLFLRAGSRDFREQLIGLLPGETLEDVARTLASRTVQVDISGDRAVVVLRLPLG
jgi:hypothetical protein